jgi:NADH-quinone oxidoreductase subunit L
LAGISAWFAYDSYVRHPRRPEAIVSMIRPVHALVANKYLVDEFYFARIINPLVDGSKALWLYIDVNVIDKATYFAGDLVSGFASFIKTLQSGKTQNYALYMALGLVIVIAVVLV